jgi:phosphatidylserine decarboxylase
MDDHKSTYESEPRRAVTQWIQSQPIYDWAYAALQHTRRSAQKIGPFVRKHHIDMSEFEQVDYPSYAAFFVRRFRPGARKFPSDSGEMGAFAEARYFGWAQLSADQKFPIKGHSLSAERILGNAERARPFIGGPVLLARLAPVDYHRVHYFDDGRTLDDDRLGSRLWTVNWHALQSKQDILFVNERQINILETQNFGRVGFVEIGAMTVGRVAQVHPLDAPFKRGQEKSVFKFGASAIAAFGEPGKWIPSQDVLDQTEKGVETLLRLGETVAMRMPPTRKL